MTTISRRQPLLMTSFLAPLKPSRSRPSGTLSLSYNSCTAAHCMTMAVAGDHRHDQKVIARRSGNFTATNHFQDFRQALGNEYAGEKYVKRAEELKEQVKVMLGRDTHDELLDFLELVDHLERLGIAYLFQPQIESLLKNTFNRCQGSFEHHDHDLYAAALTFRIFRQHGYHVLQDIFSPFMSEEGEFYDGMSDQDTKGLLALYEACFLSWEGETKLDVAREVTKKYLKTKTHENDLDQNLSDLVHHALELPLHWRAPRIEARWFINAYEKLLKKNPLLLQLAKLDFNIVQSTYQQDLDHVVSWWLDTQILENSPYIRDRKIELCFWSAGAIWEPQYVSCRVVVAKMALLSTAVDDLYDVHGTLHELELFTDAVDRWDVRAMDELPDYMRVMFLLLFNSINDIAYDTLKEQGVHIIPYLRKGWADLCRAYMQEARWYYGGYTPSVEEYLENAAISIAIRACLMHTYAAISNPVNTDSFTDLFDSIHPHTVVRCTSLLVRLMDDLATSQGEMQRGDVPKILQCRMKETGCSEEEAREYVWCLIREIWTKMNSTCDDESPLSTQMLKASHNQTRISLAIFQHGDGIGLNTNSQAKEYMRETLFAPIPIHPL